MNTDREKARKLVMEIAKLAEQYKLPIFAVTEGASITRNNGSAAVRNARLAQIEWEKANGEDPDEDWTPKTAGIKDIKTVKDLKNLYDYNQYGVLDRSTGKKHRRGAYEDWVNDWRLNTPEETIDTGIGVCYDTSHATTDILNRLGIPVYQYYASAVKDEGRPVSDSSWDPNHAYIIYKDGDRYKWLEASLGPKKKRNRYYSKDRIKLLKRISQWLADHGGPEHNGGDAMHVREVINKPRSGVNLQEYITTMQKNPIVMTVSPKTASDKSDEIIDRKWYDKILETNPEYVDKIKVDPELDSLGYIDFDGPNKLSITLKDKLPHVLAHEIGHFKARHSFTQRVADVLGTASNIPFAIPYIGYYLSMPLRGPAVALKEWGANSEGIKLLEKAGVPEEDIEKVRKDYRRRAFKALLEGD